MSTQSRKTTNSGEIVNLMQINTDDLVKVPMYFHYIYGSAIEVALTVILLWFYIGVGAFTGLATLILLGPLNSFFSRRFAKYQMEKLKEKDVKVKIINEVLNGIKVRNILMNFERE